MDADVLYLNDICVMREYGGRLQHHGICLGHGISALGLCHMHEPDGIRGSCTVSGLEGGSRLSAARCCCRDGVNSQDGSSNGNSYD